MPFVVKDAKGQLVTVIDGDEPVLVTVDTSQKKVWKGMGLRAWPASREKIEGTSLYRIDVLPGSEPVDVST